MFRLIRLVVWLGVFIVSMVACTAVPEDVSTVAPTRVLAEVTDTAVPPSSTATNKPDAPLIPTPAPMCTPPACTEHELYFCPGECLNGCGTVCATPTPDNLGPAPTTWADLETWLIQAWQERTPPETVIARLQEAGWMLEDDPFSEYAYSTIADLDGDGEVEWVFSLRSLPNQPEYRPLPGAGNLWIFDTDGIVYRYYDEVPYGADAWDNPLPQVVGINDMIGEGLPNLVIKIPKCGASTCLDSYLILQDDDGNLSNIVSRPASSEAIKGIVFEENLITVPTSDIRFEDYQGDGRPDLFVHGGTFGSSAAGMTRTFTEIWSWDGTAVTLADTLFDPTQYRHHILYDANNAYAEGDLELAASLYEQVITDEALLTPDSHFRGGTDFDLATTIIQMELHQFAAFRLILIALQQGDTTKVQSWLDWLNQQYTVTPISLSANTLVNNWNGREDIPLLCTQISNDLEATLDPEEPYFLDLGFGNPHLTLRDVCPIP